MENNKTSTIKQRSIYVYLPSKEIADTWKSLANEAGTSISKFITEIVEEHIQAEKGDTSRSSIMRSLEDLKKQNETIRNENIELQKKINMLSTLTDRYEEQLQNYKNKTFIENGKYEGVRQYQKRLVELFNKKTSIAEDEIMDLLHIDPMDTATLKAISKQIEYLQDYGLIEKIRGGWRWKK